MSIRVNVSVAELPTTISELPRGKGVVLWLEAPGLQIALQRSFW